MNSNNKPAKILNRAFASKFILVILIILVTAALFLGTGITGFSVAEDIADFDNAFTELDELFDIGDDLDIIEPTDMDELRFEEVKQQIEDNIKVKNRRDKNIDVEVEVLEDNDNTQKVKIKPKDNYVKEILFQDLDLASASNLKIDDDIKDDDFMKVYAIDPEDVAFTEAEVTATATGNTLMKCVDWNFKTRECEGKWKKIMDIKPGEDYKFMITPDDPGFAEIVITSAAHYNRKREFVEDIYSDVQAQDDVWSKTIRNNHYVRVTFEQNLTAENDITIYPRIISGTPSIEVYEKDEDIILETFTTLAENQYNTIYLYNLIGEQDTFDLKVTGGRVQFDHIVDPPTGSTALTADAGDRVWITSDYSSEYIDGDYTDTWTDDTSYYCVGYDDATPAESAENWFTTFDFDIGSLGVVGADIVNATFEWRGYAGGWNSICSPGSEDNPECADIGVCENSYIRVYNWSSASWNIFNSTSYALGTTWDTVQQTIIRSNKDISDDWISSSGIVRLGFEHNETGMNLNYETKVVSDFTQLTLEYTSIVFGQSSLDLGTVPVLGSSSDIVNVTAAGSHTNIQLDCVSGDCNIFSDNFSDGSSFSDGDSVEVNFTCGDHTSGDFSAIFNLSSDNDSSPAQLNVSCTIVVFIDEFDTGANFDNDSTNTAPWERGNATQFGGCYYGDNCWATGLTANYVGTGPYDDYLTQTTGMDFTNYGNVTLKFYHYRHFEDDTTLWDSGVVDIDNGSGWTRITPVGGYTGTVTGSSTLNGQAAYANYGSGWELAEFDLENYSDQSDVKVRFHFATDGSTNDWGWAVDRVYILGDYMNTVPAQGTPILNSTLGTNLTTENLTCYNQSTSDEDSDPVKNIFNWYKNSTSLTVLNMPFEGHIGNEATLAVDYSGYGNNGTVTNAVWDSSGFYQFDGSGDYIDLGSDQSLNFTGNDNFTISAWVRVEGGTGTHRPIVCRSDTQYCLKPSSTNVLEFCVYDGGWQCANTAGALTENVWYHLVGRVSGSEVALWVDGSKQATTGTHSGISSNSYNTFIGSDGEGTRFFNGKIDDVMIFDHDLSPEQITALYNNRTDLIVSQETTLNDTWMCEITPNDGYEDGATNQSNNLTIMDVESTPPSVTNIVPAENSRYTVSDTITISADVTDGAGVSTVYANITQPNGTVDQLSLAETQANTYENTYKLSTTISGRYNITIVANDTINNINSSETSYFIAEQGFVQRGETLGSASQLTDTIWSVNESNAFMLFKVNTTDSTPNDNQFTPNMTSSTGVSFEKYSGGVGGNIRWEVAEANYLTVQRGTESLAAGSTEVNVTITAVDQSEAFVIVYGRCADSTSGDSSAGFFAGNLTSSTNLMLRRGIGPGDCAATVSWQVVEWAGATVQSGTSTLPNNIASMTADITAVNLSETFLIFGSASLGTDRGMDSNKIRGRFNNASQLVFNIDGAYASSERRIDWYVVSVPGATVQNGTTAFGDSTTETINSVNITRAFVLSSDENTGGGQSYANSLYTTKITNDTTLSFVKATGSQTITADWFVVEMPDELAVNYPPLADIILPIVDENVTLPYNITFNVSDPNDDNINASLLLYYNGVLNTTIATDMNQSNSSYYWTGSQPAGTYNLTLLACELGTGDLYCTNDTHEINISGDTAPPSITNPKPDTTAHNISSDITISAIITDASALSVTYANVTTPDGTVIQITLTDAGSDNYTGTLANTNLLQKGRYNITFYAEDSSSNVNNSITTYFNRIVPGNKIFDVVDSTDQSYEDYTTTAIDNVSGTLKVDIDISDHEIKEIIVEDYDESSPYAVIKLEDNTDDNISFDQDQNRYLIDLSGANMTSANITVTASGYHLFKCADFTGLSCTDDDNYTMIRSGMTTGQNYTITLTATDPLFGETIQGAENTSDARFRQGAPTTNYGGLTSMRVGKTGASNAHRSIIWFNLSHIPENATIQEANLSLYFFSISGTDTNATRTHDIHRVQQSPTRPWNELNVTWNNYNESSTWSSAGGDYNSTATDSQSFNVSDLNSWIVYDVTPDVQDFITDADGNFGWIIKDSNETTTNTRRNFRSSEYGTASLRPKLEISYVITPTHSTPILNSTSGADLTTDNLTCYNQSTQYATTNIFNWYKNGTSITVLNLPFEGGSNSTYTKDYSSYGNDGAVENITWNATGGYDGFGAYEFEGGVVEGTIELGNAGTYDYDTLTVCAWVKTSYTDEQWIFANSNDDTNSFILAIDNNPGGSFLVHNGSAMSMSSTGGYNDGLWHHVCGVRNPLQIYVNGVAVADTDDAESWTLSTSDVQARIGSRRTGQDGWNGSIDDVQIFDYALSPEQIQALYANRTDLIVSNETEINDTWMCEITPSDDLTTGTTLQSNNLTIIEFTDTTDPVITLNTPPASYYNDTSSLTTFNCSATDNFNLQSIALYITDNTNSSFSLYQSSSVSGTSASAQWDLYLNTGNYTWNCLATDQFSNTDWGNSNRSFIINYTDTSDPTVSLDAPEDNYSCANCDSVFNCSVTDDFYVQNISLYLTNENGTDFSHYSTQNVGSINGSASWSLSLDPGDYEWNCLATDGAGNTDWGATNRSIEVRQCRPLNDDFGTYSGYSEYFIPGGEEQLWDVYSNLPDAPPADEGLHTIITVTAALSSTTVYYDHWEDGYDFDPNDPNATADEIVFLATKGSYVAFENSSINVSPRNNATTYYDGQDRIYTAGGPVSIVRVSWPESVQAVISFSMEVFPVQALTNFYTIPVGEDLAGPPTNYVDFDSVWVLVQAVEDNTTVLINDPGSPGIEINTTLNKGETANLSHIDRGTTVNGTKDLNVNFVTGDRTGNFEVRGYTAVPDTLWDNEYINPVPGFAAANTTLYLYNPYSDPVNLTIEYEDTDNSGIVILPPNSTRSYYNLTGNNVPQDSGVYFQADQPFWGIGSVDVDSDNYDWGYSLIPADALTRDYYIGWAPGSSNVPPTESGSPVYVTPEESDTTIFVDFSPVDGVVDATYLLDRLQTQAIYDPDNDSTGMHIFTLENKRYAVAWGEDPDTATPTAPYLDLGYTILPLPVEWLDVVMGIEKEVSPSAIGLGAGQIVNFTLIVSAHNYPVDGIAVYDSLPDYFVYINDTTSVTLPNNTVLTGAGVEPSISGENLTWDLGTNLSECEFVTIMFQANTTAGIDYGYHWNDAWAVGERFDGDQFFTPIAQVYVYAPEFTIDKDVVNSEVGPGGTVNYTIQLKNYGNNTLSNVTVWDSFQSYFTYDSGSAVEVNATRTSTTDPTPGSTSLTWGTWNISAGGTVTISFQMNVSSTTPGGTYDNTVYASSNETGEIDDIGQVGQDANTPAENDPENDEDVTVTSIAELSITKVDSSDPVSLGDTLVYTINVTNAGPSNASNVSVNDVLPAGISFNSATPIHNGSSGQVYWWNFSNVELNTSFMISVNVSVDSSTTGLINNTVNVSSVEVGDSIPSDDFANELTYIIDTSNPNVTLNGPPDGGGIPDDNATLIWTPDDNFDDTLECNLTLDGVVNATNVSSPRDAQTSVDVSGLSDGIHYWNVTCWDDWNNTNTSETWTFIVDTTDPVVELVDPPDGSNYSVNNVSLTCNMTNVDIKNITLYTNITGNWTAYQSANVSGTYANYTFNLSGLADGSYEWSCLGYDVVGNFDWADENWTFNIDTTDPVVELMTPPDGSNYSINNVSLNCNASDELGLENLTLYTNTTGSWLPYQTINVSGTFVQYAFNLTGLAEGTYGWNCLAYDVVDNLDWADNNWTFNIDTTDPVVELVVPPDNYTSPSENISLTCNATDNLGLQNLTLYTNTTGTWQPFQTVNVSGTFAEYTFNLTSLLQGEYEWNCLAYDVVDNLDWADSNWTFDIDLTDPVVELEDPVDGYNTSETNISLTCNVTNDALENLTLYTNTTGSWLPYQTINVSGTFVQYAFNLTGLAEGTYEWNCLGYDVGGNFDWADNNWTFNIDTTGPDMSDPDPVCVSDFNVSSIVPLSVNVSDPVGVGAVWVDVLTPNQTIYTVQLVDINNDSIYNGTFPNPLEKGIHNLTFYANDTLGNINNISSCFDRIVPGNKVIDVINKDYEYEIYDYNITGNQSGNLTVFLNVSNHTIKEIVVEGYNETSPFSVIIIENETNEHNCDFIRTWALDPQHLMHTRVNLTFEATGYHLFKCADFNMTTELCSDVENYDQILTGMTAGQDYTVTIVGADPGFGETIQGALNVSDAWIRGGAPNNNYGGSPIVRIGRTGGVNDIREVMWFNLSHLPDGIQIDDAHLELYFWRIPSSDVTTARTQGVYKVQQSPIRPWTELNVTWNNYDGSSTWTSAGADYAGTPTDTASVSSTELDSWIAWNVTVDVADFYNDSSTNFGWVIRDTLEDASNIRRDYHSTECACDPLLKPKLTIVYSDVQESVVELVTPPDNYTSNVSSISLTCNATDNIGVNNLTLYTDVSGTWLPYQTLNVSGTYVEQTFNLTGLSTGDYGWNCLAYDNNSNSDWADNNWTFSINLTSPVVGLESPVDGYNSSETNISLTCNVTNDALENLTLYTNTSGSWQPFQTANVSGTFAQYAFNLTGLAEGTYEWNCLGYDIDDQYDWADNNWTFSIDTTGPIVNLSSPANNSNVTSTSTTLTCNATDSTGVQNITLYTDINGNWTAYETANVSGTSVSNAFSVTGLTVGTYKWNCLAFDVLGNSDWADNNWTFNVVSADTAVAAGYECVVTQTPHVAEPGETELLQIDVSYADGTPAFASNITSADVAIVQIADGNTTYVENGTATYLSTGVWFYEFDTTPWPDGNYMAVINTLTDQLPPVNVTCTALFSISGRGLLYLDGITPDLVEVDQTVRLAIEALWNGEQIDESLLQDATLFVTMVNGTNQTFNYSSLVVSDGLIYADGFFDETGIYFLNWSVTYFNRTKSVSEIVAVTDFADINVTVDVDLTDIEDLIIDNRNHLINVLSEMERAQEFSEEEVFLITDAVNSMSKVVGHLNEGTMTDEDAAKELNKIQGKLVSEMGGKISGHLVYDVPSKKKVCKTLWFLCWWYWILVLMLGVMVAAVIRRNLHIKTYHDVIVPAKEKVKVYYDRYSERAEQMRQYPRRYEIILMNLKRAVRGNKKRRLKQSYYPSGDNKRLSDFFNEKGIFVRKLRKRDKQEQLGDWIPPTKEECMRPPRRKDYVTPALKANRQKNRDMFRRDQRRRYEIILDNIMGRLVQYKYDKYRQQQRKQDEYYRRQMNFRKAKASEVFNATPEEAQPTRFELIMQNLKARKKEADSARRMEEYEREQELMRRRMQTKKARASEIFNARPKEEVKELTRYELLTTKLLSSIDAFNKKRLQRKKEILYEKEEEQRREKILTLARDRDRKMAKEKDELYKMQTKGRVEKVERAAEETVDFGKPTPAPEPKKQDIRSLEQSGFAIKRQPKKRELSLLEKIRPKDEFRYSDFKYEGVSGEKRNTLADDIDESNERFNAQYMKEKLENLKLRIAVPSLGIPKKEKVDVLGKIKDVHNVESVSLDTINDPQEVRVERFRKLMGVKIQKVSEILKAKERRAGSAPKAATSKIKTRAKPTLPDKESHKKRMLGEIAEVYSGKRSSKVEKRAPTVSRVIKEAKIKTKKLKERPKPPRRYELLLNKAKKASKKKNNKKKKMLKDMKEVYEK